ncbi:hypothetical protein DAT35_02960 [Vitiosangium sp. GDMCC 1.1324]|nr:hypothetical protein DAT35_02960 [Vitiosangium sp. GDMCC 1.1324]
MVRLLSSVEAPGGGCLPDELDDRVFTPDKADELAAAIELLREPEITRLFELERGRLVVRREIGSEERHELASHCRRNSRMTQMRREP